MNIDIENDLRKAIAKNEKFLWTGRPRTGILLRSSDLFVIPISLLWLSIALLWIYTALKTGGDIFGAFALLFMIIGFYATVGRFFADSIKRKNTVYGITDNRVIVKSGIFSRGIRLLDIKAISYLTIKEKKDGSGTISFVPPELRYMIFSGMGYWPAKFPPSLEFIEEVKKVHKILIDRQRKLSLLDAAGSTDSRLKLVSGRKYKVVKPFTDYDRFVHEIGETWTFMETNFLPYEDGLTLHVLNANSTEIIYRLQWRKEEQADIIENFSEFVTPC